MRLHRQIVAAAALCATLITGCAMLTPSAPPPAITATAPSSLPGVESAETLDVVAVQPLGGQVTLGSEAEWGAVFSPTRMTFLRDADGNLISTSYSPDDSRLVDVREMRVCIAWDEPCQPPDEWSPFKPRLVREGIASWHDERRFWIAAEFRDSQGRPVPALSQFRGSEPALSLEDYGVVTSLVDASTPAAIQPPLAQTALAITAVAFPVQGSVVLQNGLCCAGGTAGTTINVTASFEAASEAGDVVEMQVTGCGSGDWEPFAAEKTCQTTATSNWTTFQISVRFRDDQGNLSPVYTDDIAVEGMPPRP